MLALCNQTTLVQTQSESFIIHGSIQPVPCLITNILSDPPLSAWSAGPPALGLSRAFAPLNHQWLHARIITVAPSYLADSKMPHVALPLSCVQQSVAIVAGHRILSAFCLFRGLPAPVSMCRTEGSVDVEGISREI